MGLIRKAASVSTLGAVNYRSGREQRTRATKAQAELTKEQARAVRDQRRRDAREEHREPAALAEEQAEGLPWWRQPTLGGAIRTVIQQTGQGRKPE